MLGPELVNTGFEQQLAANASSRADTNLLIDTLFGLANLGLQETPQQRFARTLIPHVLRRRAADGKVSGDDLKLLKFHSDEIDNARQRAIAQLKFRFPSSIVQDPQTGKFSFIGSLSQELEAAFQEELTKQIQASQIGGPSGQFLPEGINIAGIGNVFSNRVEASQDDPLSGMTAGQRKKLEGEVQKFLDLSKQVEQGTHDSSTVDELVKTQKRIDKLAPKSKTGRPVFDPNLTGRTE